MPNGTNIKKQLSRISPLSAVVILLFASAMTYFVFRAFAASGTATLYTSPGGSQSTTTGQSFTVSVRISSGASVPITGASVYLSYPTDKLQVVSQSYGGPYNTQLIESNSGGILRMDRAAFPAVSGGDQLFAQVTFKALATGSAAVSFTGSSLVTSGEDDSNILAQKNGVTYTISAPATPPPTTSPSGGSSGSTSSGSTGSTSRPATSTSKPATSSSTGGSSSGTSGSPTATTADGTPTATTSEDGTLVTEGAVSSIEIAILDSNNKPVEGASVTLNGQTVKTDEKGIAHFDGVPAGQQNVAVQYNGKKTTKVVQVKGASTKASPERFNVAIARDKFNPAVLVIPLLVLAAAGVLFLRPWKGHFATAGVGAESTADDIVTSDRLFIETPTTVSKQAPGSVVAPGGQDAPPASPAPANPQTTVKPDNPDETPKP